MALGPFKILLILMLIVLLFGAGRIPALAENLAKGLKSFKKGLRDDDPKSLKSITDQEDEG